MAEEKMKFINEYHRQNTMGALECLRNQGPIDIPKEIERHRKMHEALKNSQHT